MQQMFGAISSSFWLANNWIHTQIKHEYTHDYKHLFFQRDSLTLSKRVKLQPKLRSCPPACGHKNMGTCLWEFQSFYVSFNVYASFNSQCVWVCFNVSCVPPTHRTCAQCIDQEIEISIQMLASLSPSKHLDLSVEGLLLSNDNCVRQPIPLLPRAWPQVWLASAPFGSIEQTRSHGRQWSSNTASPLWAQ